METAKHRVFRLNVVQDRLSGLIFFAVVLDTMCGFSAYIMLLADSYRERKVWGMGEGLRGYFRNWAK
jgi:hypothetical protein